MWAGLVPAGGSRENLFFCLLHLWRLSGLSSYLTSLPLLLPISPLPLVLPVITAIIPDAECSAIQQAPNNTCVTQDRAAVRLCEPKCHSSAC